MHAMGLKYYNAEPKSFRVDQPNYYYYVHLMPLNSYDFNILNKNSDSKLEYLLCSKLSFNLYNTNWLMI